MDIPQKLVENAERVFGDRARAWLPGLPGVAAACRDRWDLAEGIPAPHMSMNYIELTTTAEDCPVALKIGVPHDDLYTEMEALRAYDGQAAVGFIDSDHDLGAILMDRVQPGTMLFQSGCDDAEQTRLAGAIMRELPVTVPQEHGMPHLTDQVAKAFTRNRTTPELAGTMPEELMQTAEDLLRQLLTDEPTHYLLHGDLHHENILLDEQRGWLAIDPKGVIGPRAYQPARFLNNRLPEGSSEKHADMTRLRLDILSEILDCPSATLAAAAFLDRILGTSWSLEDEGTFDMAPALANAHMLQRFL